MRKSILAGSLAFVMFGAQAQQQAGVETAQQAIPDGPKPQPTLPNAGTITPGKGTTSNSSGDTPNEVPSSLPSSSPATPAASEPPTDQTSIELSGGEGIKALTIRGPGINFVDVPFQVKDSKGKLVSGLHIRDIQIEENGLRQSPVLFTTDPRPMSVAFVIDQSLPHSDMVRVDEALGAVQGAFAPYDEVAVFTYNNGPKMVTDFTASQSTRLHEAIEVSKSGGRDALMPGTLSGPLSQPMTVNGQVFDPNVSAKRGSTNMQMTPEREVHTLNDAILMAATKLSRSAPERLRVVYVISDGKEAGSQAKFKDVVKYLQTNKIAVYGTLVGDSAVKGIGFLDRIHLPLMMRDNILPAYANETGGNFDAEYRTAGIERSFAEIAKEVRTQYTIGYNTHESFLDGKYRKLNVTVMNHGNDLTVISKQGYYPSAMDAAPPKTLPAQ